MSMTSINDQIKAEEVADINASIVGRSVPEDEKLQCETCGFMPPAQTVQGLARHKQAKHGEKGARKGKRRKRCPECDGLYHEQSIKRHRETVHGVEFEKKGRKSVPKSKRHPLSDDDMQAMLTLIFPDGIPASRFGEAAAWVDATKHLAR